MTKIRSKAAWYCFSLFVLASSVLVFLSSHYVYYKEIQKINLELTNVVREKAQLLQNDLNILTNQTLFLSQLPSVIGISKLPSHQFQTEAFVAFEEELATTFKVYLDNIPSIIQARYIGIQDNGREIVRVEKNKGGLIIVDKDQLQQKGSRHYFKEISKLSHKEVFISDITLNQENGKFDFPYLPVIRLGTPVYAQHHLKNSPSIFGEIIINVDAEKIFQKLKNNNTTHPNDLSIYVLNSQEDFLAHPDKNKTFRFELGSPYKWADEFKVLGNLIIHKNNIRIWSTLDAQVVAKENIYLSPDNTHRKITLVATLPVKQAIEHAAWVALFSFIALCVAFFIYLYIQNKSSLRAQELHLKHAIEMEREINDIINNDPHGKLIINSKGMITLVNTHIEKVFGYKKSELLAQPMSILLPERYRAQHPHFMQAYFRDPEIKAMGAGRNLFGLHKTGHEVPLEIGLSPIIYRGEQQTLCGIVDISLRRKLEKQFELLVEAAPNAIILISHDGKMELVNKAAEIMFVYSRSQMIDHSFDLLIPSRFQSDLQNCLNELFDYSNLHEKSINQDLCGLRNRGNEFPITVNLRSIETPQGTKILASVTDLSERVEKDLALKRISDTLDRTNKMAGVGGWDLNLLTQKLIFTEETYRIYGLPVETAITIEQFIAHYTPESQIKLRNAIQKASTLGENWDLELPFITEQGKSIWVRTMGTTEFENGRAVKIVGTFQDITERKFFIEELYRSNIELHNFAYVASHDLKSPLRGIDQLASWLEEDLKDKLEDDDVEHLRLMRIRINRMENLLDDLLAYSRAGKKGALTKQVNLNILIQEIFDLCNVKQTFKIKLDNVLPTFETESIPLEQVFRNLINNSIKHSNKENGEIHISVASKNGFYVFRVYDDGPGIPSEYEERIFTMFQTLKPRDEVEGSGMGLAIVRKIITTFGGEIYLDKNTESDKGACFIFTWPEQSKNH